MKRNYISPAIKVIVVRHSNIMTGSTDSIGVSTSGGETLDGGDALAGERHSIWN